MSRVMGSVLSKWCETWLYHTNFDGFKVFKTYLRSMTKSDDSIKPNLSLHNMKVCAILEVYLYYCINIYSYRIVKNFGSKNFGV